jgi:hypothetical protein
MTALALTLDRPEPKGQPVKPSKREDDDQYRFNVTVRLPKAAVDAMDAIITHRGGNISKTALITSMLLEEARRHKLIQ